MVSTAEGSIPTDFEPGEEIGRMEGFKTFVAEEENS